VDRSEAKSGAGGLRRVLLGDGSCARLTGSRRWTLTGLPVVAAAAATGQFVTRTLRRHRRRPSTRPRAGQEFAAGGLLDPWHQPQGQRHRRSVYHHVVARRPRVNGPLNCAGDRWIKPFAGSRF
jgi:hypothetical protein